jgi:hypothetical protein
VTGENVKGATGLWAVRVEGRKMFPKSLSLRSSVKLVAGVWRQFFEKHYFCGAGNGSKHPSNNANMSIGFIRHLEFTFS